VPIKPENLALYPANWKSEIRPRILERDGHRCKFCGVPNHTTICRVVIAGVLAWADPVKRGVWYSAADGSLLYSGFAIGEEEGRHTRIVLTIAHLHDPDPSNCDDENLAALCQRCHLRHDAPMHREHRAATHRAKRAVADLFDTRGVA
jgi:5-methylcytosine-specific restriction endonuclease McrA